MNDNKVVVRWAHPSPTKLIVATSRFLDFENETLQTKQISYRQERIQDDDDHVEGNDEELAESNEELLFARNTLVAQSRKRMNCNHSYNLLITSCYKYQDIEEQSRFQIRKIYFLRCPIFCQTLIVILLLSLFVLPCFSFFLVCFLVC